MAVTTARVPDAAAWIGEDDPGAAPSRLQAFRTRRERRHRRHRLGVAAYVSVLVHLGLVAVALRALTAPAGHDVDVFAAATIVELADADDRPAPPVAAPPAATPSVATPARTAAMPARAWTPGATAPDAELTLASADAEAGVTDAGTSLQPAALVVDAPAPPPAAVLAALPVAPPHGSPWGAGLGPVVLRLDGPRTRTTTRPSETISGRVVGGTPARLIVDANDVEREIALRGDAFEATVALRRGLNVVRVRAVDASGTPTEETIAVDFTPPPPAVAITSPGDGQVVTAATTTAIEGVVDADGDFTVWIVSGDREVAVPVRDGRFRQIVPLTAPVVRLWAEVRPEGGPAVRSEPVTIVTSLEPVAVLAMDWVDTGPGLEAEVRASWRSRADRADAAAQPLALGRIAAAHNARLPELVYLKSPRPGVYTFEVRYRGPAPAGASLRPVLYLPAEGGLKAKSPQRTVLDGSGQVVVARLLLPQGVLWDDTEWFTGQSESADTITRFRLPEGVVWTEAKTAR